ncbi:Flagellar secretion chaperone FliS [Schaedlerella arabinosiphila]|jgi:flagellar protein FliS|uniref:flagellar export chaperone FliS n=1 Tax=Schaedlerella arabinosiphila TaxID=2044587 RepID=UPI0002CB633C|nr:flagellar export chaperone FliS [Schaedlerella arabinosiphila]KAI4441834.1 Flagellar secretion chaperone FliS [Schaedlerella arabinosiphila]MCI9631882.1 flagellar export chaperone FliS [Ruminococcus sp.]
MYQNGYEQYKMQSVNTMTSGEMLLLLYDELLKRLARAQVALEDENYDLFNQSVQRSKEIVQYLDFTLNMEYKISYELRRMYEFFLYELSRLQAGRKVAVIQELKPLVGELRDAFKEASKTAVV